MIRFLKHKKLIIFTLFVSLIMCVLSAISAIPVHAKNGVVLECSVAAEYELNTEFELPIGEITYQGEKKQAQGELVYPSGQCSTATSVILTEAGKYTLRYTADFNGEEIREEKCFIVKYKTYSETAGCQVNYGAYKHDESIEGLHISLANGSKFVYNKVIDVTGITQFDTLLRLYTETNTIGVAECESFILTLTDVYDAENQIKIQVKRNPYTQGKSNLYLTYVNTKFPGQAYTSWYYYQDNGGYSKKVYVSRFGTVTRFSFSSNVQYGGATYAQSYLDFRFDDDEKSLYAVTDPKVVHMQSGKYSQLIADYDDVNMFSEKWKGFTTGEVILSLEAGTYVGSQPAGFFITKILDEDLSDFEFSDEVEPVITLEKDYGMNIPTGVKGEKYPIVNAVYTDAQSGICKSGVEVFKNFGQEGEEESNVYGNYFIPSSAGDYTIVYYAEDFFGNRTSKMVSVKVYDEKEPMYISFEQSSNGSYFVGEVITIPVATAIGGAGDVSVSTTVGLLNDKDVWNIVDGKFQPQKSGRYFVSYKATDYIGSIKVDGFVFDVTLYEGAVFDSEPVLPKYFLAGFAYQLPELYGYDYTSGEKVAVKANIKAEDGVGSRELVNGEYIPTIIAEQENVTITYYIGERSQTFEVPCISVVKGSVFTKANYFIYDTKQVSVDAKSDGMNIIASQNLASVEFANQLLADGFEVSFSIPKEKSNFNKFSIYITDSIDPSVQVKVSVEKMADSSGAYFYINDGDKFSTAASFGSNTLFYVKFNNRTRVVSDGVSSNILVNNALNGDVFEGFASGMVYLRFEFESVSGESGIFLKSINSCAMNSKTNNPVFPEFAPLGPIRYNVQINDTIVIPAVKAASVLNPSVKCSMTVYLPNGAIAVSTDGIELNEVACDREYSIIGNQYGSYQVKYEAKDSKNKSNEYAFVVTVVDREKPVITVTEGIVSQAKLGTQVKVPVLSTSDNLNQVTLMRCYKTPNGDIVYLSNDNSETASFVVDTVGEYIIRYMAFDEFGNSTTKDFKIIVTE